MKALVYILIIGIALFTGFLMSNTFFRAHYLGIGKKVNFNLTLAEQECNFGECILSFRDDFEPHSMYLIPWNKAPLRVSAKARVLIIINEFGHLCLTKLETEEIQIDFSHIAFCNKVTKQTEEEWSKSRLTPSRN